MVLTITVPTQVASVAVRAFGRELRPFGVDSQTWRVLVGIDLDVKPGNHPVDIAAGADRTVFPLVVTRRLFPTRTLTVDEAFVNPPPDAVERIASETLELNRLWESSAPERLWSGAFVRPVPDPANSAFGTRTILNGQPRSPHGGADFSSPTGRPVFSPNAGRVVRAGALYYTGQTVVIDHGLGLVSLFAHLSSIAVREGEVVKTGDTLGDVGATGRVTGAHLHWTVRLNGARIDPLALLAVLGDGR